MKCTKCHEKEAVCTENCLVVEHTEREILGVRKEISERLSGMKTVGLCEECQKKAAREQTGKSKIGAMIALTCGLVGLPAGILFMASLSTNRNRNLSILLGVLVAICLIGGLLSYYVIIPLYLMKKNPAILFPYASTDTERYVPFKKEYYKDYNTFNSLNRIDIEQTSKKLFELIESDQLVGMLVSAAMASEQNDASDLPDDGSTLNRCVNRLLELYRQKPEGYLVGEASQVRAVGEELNKEGGMELMLQAHALFSQKNTRMGMARNLEMVWDGIGNWQG